MIVRKSMPHSTHKVVPRAIRKCTDLCAPVWHDCLMGKLGKPTAAVVADNIARILTYRGMDATAAAKLLGVKPFQVKRLMAADHAMTLRTLDRLAEVFGLEPYQLLIPGLDAGNPQVLRVLSAAEQRLYEALEAARANGRA